MELGGNIELFGADEYDDNELIIIKKLVGHYTKHLTESYPSFEGLRVQFDYENAQHKLQADAQLGDETTSVVFKHKNLYFALDGVLKELLQEIEA